MLKENYLTTFEAISYNTNQTNKLTFDIFSKNLQSIMFHSLLFPSPYQTHGFRNVWRTTSKHTHIVFWLAGAPTQADVTASLNLRGVTFSPPNQNRA